jgi:uncharacterized protein YraI
VLIALLALVLLIAIPAGLISLLSGRDNASASGEQAAVAQVTVLVTIYPSPTFTPEPTSAATDTPQPTPTSAPTLTPTAAVTPEAAIVAQLTVTDTGDYANVRSGPGITYTVMGQLNKGQTAPVNGRNADSTWYRIDLNGKPGWVYILVARINGDAGSVPVVAVTSDPLSATTVMTATATPGR